MHAAFLLSSSRPQALPTWIKLGFGSALCLMMLSWHTPEPGGSDHLNHQTEHFTIHWQQHGIQIKHASGRVLVESPPEAPFISPAAVNDHATLGTTIRFKPQITPNIAALGKIQKVKLGALNSSVMYAIKLHNFCREYLLITLKEIHDRAMVISAELSGYSAHEPFHASCEALAIAVRTEAGESFVGLGTQPTLLHLNGHTFTTLSQEQGHGRGLQPLTWISNRFAGGVAGDETTSYHTVAHVLSNHMRSWWLYSERHAHFDFSAEDQVIIAPTEPFFKVRFNLQDSLKGLVQEFAQEFGTTKPMPPWVHRGAMMGLQGGEQHIYNTLEDLRAHNTPMASVWIQDWLGSFQTIIGQRLIWNWRTDHKLYPHWSTFVQDLDQQGLRVLSYFNPRVKNRCNNICTFQMAKQQGYLVKTKLGQPYLIGNGGFNFAKIDLFHIGARHWLAQLIRTHFTQAPIKGWMADFSEALPLDAVLADGTTGMASHNRYIYEWSRLNGSLIDEIDEGFVFMRGGVLGSHRHVHGFWLGDQLTSWDHYDGLHSTVIGLITSGLSGALVNHSDIGGLSNIRIPLVAHIQRTKELFLRWTQLNAFTPIFRTHEGLRPDHAHQFNSDPHTFKEFARYARIFTSLFPYRQQLVAATQQGLPMVRGMFFEYPHLEAAWHIDDQFMLGDQLIVAPVLTPAATHRSVWLPPGCWIEVFSQTTYNIASARSLQIKVAADHIPVFALQHSLAHRLLTTAIAANPPYLAPDED